MIRQINNYLPTIWYSAAIHQQYHQLSPIFLWIILQILEIPWNTDEHAFRVVLGTHTQRSKGPQGVKLKAEH